MRSKKLHILAVSILLAACHSAPKDNAEAVAAQIKKDSGEFVTEAEILKMEKADPDIEAARPDSSRFDSILNLCLNMPGEQSTEDIITCYYNAATKLDTLIDKVYVKLYAKLDEEDKAKLKLSQDNWKLFFKSESDFLAGAFYSYNNQSKYGHGRDYAIYQSAWRYKVVRQRLIDMTKYDEEIIQDEKKPGQ